MKRFEFSFQYLLDAHQAREQAAEHALHTAIKEQMELQQQQQAKQKHRAAQVSVLQAMTRVVNRADYAAYVRSIDTVQREMDHLQGEVELYDQKIQACRDTLQQEMTSRKVLENLKTREREEWALDMQVEDQKQMDELAVGRWSRQARKL